MPFVPVNYDYNNLYNAHFSPGTVHVQNTHLAEFFRRYLWQKLYSVFDFDIPEDWDVTYFRWSLFWCGRLAVFDTPKFGKIFQHCTLGGRGLYYQPTRALIANPVIRDSLNLEIGTECALVKMQPDYCGAYDLVSYYADLLALSSEALGMNLVNSKLAYAFASSNKAGAESFKKMFDQIQEGNPAVFYDKELLDEDGNITWQSFANDLQRNYIAGAILEDIAKIDAQFNTLIGIPNVNIAKLSGVTSDEVHANDSDVQSRAVVWCEEIQKGFDKANELYGLDLRVKYRYANEMEEQEDLAYESENLDRGPSAGR